MLINISFAQRAFEPNLPDHDDKLYYFGIVLGYNTSHYNIVHHPSFLNPNSAIKSVESLNAGRVHLGIMANLQLTRHLDLRGYPLNLIFSEKKFLYTVDPASSLTPSADPQKVESIVMSFPLQLRLKSDRIKNFRVYTLAGIKYDYDLARNSSNNPNIIKVKKSDFGIEGGIGFQFFFPYFILAPEVKFSYGLSNVHDRDDQLIYSSVIDKLNSRMIMFSLHFEGGGLGGNRRF